MTPSARDAEEKSAPGIAAQIEDLLGGDDKKRRRARRELQRSEAAEVVPALVTALAHAPNRGQFERVASLLAKIGGDQAALALAQQAQEKRAWVGTAIRYLSRCDHPEVLPTLLRLLAEGRRRQRISAADALARLQAPAAIAPLARIAAAPDDDLRHHAYYALLAIGRPDEIVRLALTSSELAIEESARTLRTLHVCQGRWPYPLFRVDRSLRRAGTAPVGDPARIKAVISLYHAHDVLLRPASLPAETSLLRAATLGDESDPAQLVRASVRPDGIDLDGIDPDGESGSRVAWWQRWLNRLRIRAPR